MIIISTQCELYQLKRHLQTPRAKYPYTAQGISLSIFFPITAAFKKVISHLKIN